MSRHPLKLVAAITLAGGVALWFFVFDPARRHLKFCEEVHAELKSLTKKRPPGISRQQWESVVAWTLNGYGNSLTFTQSIPQEDRDRFLTELREKLSGPVDLATIDWIWDQFEYLSPDAGHRYSQSYRPTSANRLREFEEPGSGWCISWGLHVD